MYAVCYMGRSTRMTEIVTKAALVEFVHAKNTSLTKRLAGKITDDVFIGMCRALKMGKGIQIKGLGTFKVVHRAGREYVSLQTRVKKRIGARKTIKFTPSIKLKNSLNGSGE